MIKTRQEALEIFRNMSIEQRLDVHAQSEQKHWHFTLFCASSSAIQSAINKQILEKQS